MPPSPFSTNDSDRASTKPDTDPLINESTLRRVDVDAVLHTVGKYGKYQLFQTLILTIGAIGWTPSILGGIFTGKDVKFKCADDSTSSSNSSDFVSFCEDLTFTGNTSAQGHSDGSCHEYVYEKGQHASHISEWDLICDKEVMGHLAQMLTMVGMGAGAFFLPQLGDRFGRRKLLLGSELTTMVVLAIMAFSTSFEMFAVLKFLAGAANQGQIISAATINVELYPVEQRSMVAFLYVVIWVISYVLLVGVSWLMQGCDWTTIQLVYAFLSAGVLIQIFFQDESLRWSMGKGDTRLARAVLVKACRWNGKKYDDVIASVTADMKPRSDSASESVDKTAAEKLFVNANIEQADKDKASQTSNSFLDLFKTPGVRKITLIMAYTWCINSLTYYGLLLMSSSLFGDLYLNNVVGALMELASGGVMFYSIYRYGRKRTLIMFILLAGTFLLTTVLVATFAPSTEAFLILQTALVQLGKCFIAGSFNTLWCFTLEVYPTDMRNMGTGFCSTCARIGATMSPVFRLLVKQVPWAPGTIFSACCFLSAFMLVVIPETRYRELPTSIAEIEAWFVHDKKTKEQEKKTKQQKKKARNALLSADDQELMARKATACLETPRIA